MSRARQLTEAFHEVSLKHVIYRDSDNVRSFCAQCRQVWWGGGGEEFSAKVEALVES